MQEEINEKSLTLAVRVGKITAAELKKAVEKLLAKMEQKGSTKNVTKNNAKTDKKPDPKHGKQTLKQLSAHNDGLSTVELKDPNLRLLYREMKRHNIDFAPVKDGKGAYTLFFKGRDADTMTHAFKRYTATALKLEDVKALKKDLAAAKAEAKALLQNRGKEKNRSRGARDR